MSETTDTVSRAESGRPKRAGRRLAWVGGGAALVLVAGVLVVPQVVHAQRVSEYTELVAQHDDALIEQAAAEAMLEAARALTVAQQSEVDALAQRLIDVGGTPEPILTVEHAQSLTKAGEAVRAVVGEQVAASGEAAETGEAAGPVGDVLVEAVEVLRAEDAAASTAADEAGEEAPVPLAPASYLSLDIAKAAAIIDATQVPRKTPVVADEDVTVELIEETAQHVADTHAEVDRLEGLIRAEAANMDELKDAVEETVPILAAAAKASETQATRIVELTPKAPTVSAAAVTAAQHAQEIAHAEDAVQMLDGLVGYIEAARAAQTEHAAVVKREKEAAEAAARAEAERAAARQQQANRGGGGGGGRNRSRLCSRYRPSPGGGGSLVLVYC